MSWSKNDVAWVKLYAVLMSIQASQAGWPIFTGPPLVLLEAKTEDDILQDLCGLIGAAQVVVELQTIVPVQRLLAILASVDTSLLLHYEDPILLPWPSPPAFLAWGSYMRANFTLLENNTSSTRGTGSGTGSGEDCEVNNLDEPHGIWYNYASAYEVTMLGKPHADKSPIAATILGESFIPRRHAALIMTHEIHLLQGKGRNAHQVGNSQIQKLRAVTYYDLGEFHDAYIPPRNMVHGYTGLCRLFGAFQVVVSNMTRLLGSSNSSGLCNFSLQRVRRLFCMYYLSPSAFSRPDIADFTSIVEELHIHHFRSSSFRDKCNTGKICKICDRSSAVPNSAIAGWFFIFQVFIYYE
ncbi:uncharacterized protein F5147DRAFT_820768 [Suillus discolor]|uniref:FHA domain-containing protein n=1 Tax=Suillus discolor TaxID=1912936 RepID=A0A9P7JP71_9AGAM|nr:uncharacterized protein F5147DRAFT_820768 [Suillus discolor]KAG2094032.1 hypothetical protein F5147DRAFT_820768 [Suillus discolor]